jgi:uncharacterized membrane protein
LKKKPEARLKIEHESSSRRHTRAPRATSRENARIARADAYSSAMSGDVLAMAALMRAHAASSWRTVHIQELLDESLAFAGHARTSDRRVALPDTISITALTNALGRYGLSMDVSDEVLETIRDEEDEESATSVRAIVLLSCLAGGGFDVKLDLVFRALDVHNVRGISSEQCVEFAADCARVLAAVLESSGESSMEDLEFARGLWNTCVREAVAATGDDASLGMFTREQFKGLTKSLLARLGKASMESAEGEAHPQERHQRRRRTSSGSTGMTNEGQSASGMMLDATALIQTAAGVFAGDDSAKRKSSGSGGGILGRVLETVTRASGHRSPLRGSSTHNLDSERRGSHERRMSHDSEFSDAENGIVRHTPTPHHRKRASSSGMDWLSIIPGSIAEMMGMQTKSTPDLSTKPHDMTNEEWEHAKLAAEVDAAREETNMTETAQVVEESNWTSLIGFVKELVIRVFLFNTVRLLLTIALLGGDAALCIYVIQYFGIVGGLGFVVIINVAFSIIFIFFMLKYNKRETGRENMQFGANLVQNIQDIAKSKAALEGLTSYNAGGSERDPASPRYQTWSDQDPTPRAFGRSDTRQDVEKRVRRTMSGNMLADQG